MVFVGFLAGEHWTNREWGSVEKAKVVVDVADAIHASNNDIVVDVNTERNDFIINNCLSVIKIR